MGTHPIFESDFDCLTEMGVVFLEHPGGARYFCCMNCKAPLTNRSELSSTRFTGATGRAYLFNKVVNVSHSAAACRIMLTGRHIVRDVYCKGCETKLGWMYEFATHDDQQYKEGKTILERALICEKEGFLDDQLNTSLTRSNSLNSRTRFLQSTDEE